jgi:cytochrome c-type biogenesis protein CcmH
LSVKDSEAGFSTSIKGKIRELMKQGESDEEIIAYFVERYGEWILRAPPVSGFNMVLWVLPGAAIVAGLLWVLYRSKNWVEKPTKEMTRLTPEEEKKLMDDLSRFEKS